MNLTTPVDIAPSPLRIDHSTPLLLMGSCFSDEIGGRLQRAGFEVLCNPFGTLYNPLSIAIALHHALDDREIDTDWLIHRDGLWHSWMHHSRFSHADHDTCLAQSVAAEGRAKYTSKEQLQKAIQQAKKNMEKAVKEMDFLSAAKYRDEMLQLQIEIEKMK